MAENANSESEETKPKPEALSAERAVSALSGWAQLAIGSFATFSGLLYAMGYLLTLGQMRMLGAGTIDVSNQEIVRKVIRIPLLSVVCALIALVTLEGLLLAAALLLVHLNSDRLGLFRQQPVEGEKPRSMVLRWLAPFVLLVIVSLYASIVLAGKVLKQRDLLLQSQSVIDDRIEQPTFTPFLLSTLPVDDLVKLKASESAGHQVYGFQVLSIVFCLMVLAGMWISWQYAEESSSLRQGLARLMLGTASLLVLLQLLNIPFLYGYLVMDTKFAAIETASFPTEKVSKFQARNTDNRLLILDTSSSGCTVYSPIHRQLWSGVSDSDLLPAKQISEIDPFAFSNPLTAPKQIKTIFGSRIDGPAEKTSPVKILSEHWADALTVPLPAMRQDALADTSSDEADYSAQWKEIGTLDITTYRDEVLHLTLFDVVEQSGEKRDHYLVFKRSIEGPENLSPASETDSEVHESLREESEFVGRSYDRCGTELKLEPGSYYHHSDPVPLQQLLKQHLIPKPAEESAVDAENPAEAGKPPAEAGKPAAEAEKPAAEADKHVTEKPAPDAEKPAAEAEKPVAEAEKPAAEADKPVMEKPASDAEKRAADADKPTDSLADKPAGKHDRPELTESPGKATKNPLDNIRLKTK